MLRPTAIQVEAICAYKILVVFDNGEKKSFDVEPYIKGEWYGQDICPAELYDLGELVS